MRITAPPGLGPTIVLLRRNWKVVPPNACHWFGGWVPNIIPFQSARLSSHYFLPRVPTGITSDSAGSAGIRDLLFLPAHGSRLLPGTSQRTFVGLACGTTSPLCVTSQRGHLFLRESCRSRGSGCDAPEGALAPGSGRLLGRWKNLIPQPLWRTHVFENLLGRQDLLIFSTSCD